jgi:hypothetical protein
LDVAARAAVDREAEDRGAEDRGAAEMAQGKDSRPEVTVRYRVALQGKAVDLTVDGVDRVDVGVVGDLGRRRALRL